MIKPPMRSSDLDPNLAAYITGLSGAKFVHCYSCLSCSGGCPFYEAMDMGPHGVMRRLIFGIKKEILLSNTIWLCVGCHTCSTFCPMAIDISAIMDSLRRLALKEGVTPAEPNILDFHREVIESIRRHGRTHKLEIMLRYKVRSGKWLEDMDLGLKMLAKRKLDLMPSNIKKPRVLKSLFEKT